MGRDYYQRTLVGLVVALKAGNGSFINNDSLIDGTKDLMKEPREDPDRAHRVIAKHLDAHLLSSLM